MGFRLSRSLNRLRIEGVLVCVGDFRQRTMLDLSGNSNTWSVVAGTPKWIRTSRGEGIYNSGAGTDYVGCGNAASLQFNTGTVISVVQPNMVRPYATPLFKYRAWITLFLTTGGLYKYSLWDPTSGLPISIHPTVIKPGVPVWCASTFQNGVVNGSTTYVNGAPSGLFGTLTVVNQTNPVTTRESANEGLEGEHLLHAMINRVLTPAEIAQVYADWLAEGWVGDPPRRIAYSYPSKRASEYAAAGIILDSDFGSEMAAGVRRIRDLTGNFPGAITNVFVPSSDAGSSVYASSQLAYGAVAQLSGATKATIVFDAQWDSVIASGRYMVQFTDGVANAVQCLCVGGGGGVSQFRCTITRAGVAAYAETTGLLLRGNQRQHVVVVYNGAGATNADRLKIFIDGESVPLTYSGNIAADLGPGMSGYYGVNPITAVHTIRQYQVRAGVALTPTQARDLYMEWFAKQIDWLCSGEATPVSLVASVAAPAQLGDWRVISGNWHIVESSNGKRWLECVNLGYGIGTDQPYNYGTWYWRSKTPPVAGIAEFSFISSTMTDSVTPGTKYGYEVRWSTALVSLVKFAGAGGGTVMQGAGLTADTEYEFCVTRRPSDGRISLYIRGGAFTNWSLVPASVAGSNPFTDLTPPAVAGKYCVFTNDVLVRHCIFDPAKPGQFPTHYQGVLNPCMGELPDTSLINMLGMSNQFTQPPWSDSGGATITVTDGVYASPGGTPAHAARLDILAGGGTAFVRQSIVSSATAQYTGSVYVRAVVGNTCTVLFWNGASTYSIQVNLTTGVATPAATAFTNAYCWTENAGGGWWRICWSVTAGAGTLEMDVYGDNAGDVLAADQAQLVQGPCAGRYRETQ